MLGVLICKRSDPAAHCQEHVVLRAFSGQVKLDCIPLKSIAIIVDASADYRNTKLLPVPVNLLNFGNSAPRLATRLPGM